MSVEGHRHEQYAIRDHTHSRVIRCTSNSAAATTGTYVVPTGFTSPSLTAGRSYHYKIVGWYQAAGTTYAIQHRLRFPTLTAGSAQNMTFSATVGGAAAGTATYPVLSSTSQVMVCATVTTPSANIGFTIEGLLIPSANGSFTYDFTPSNVGTVTVMAGTFMLITEVS